MVTEPRGRGGARAGAGRPLLGETRTERRSVTLEEQHWRWLDAKGNASAALRELIAEVQRLRETEREGMRVLGAVVYYHCSGQVTLSEAALLDDYAVERSPDLAAAAVRFKAWPTARHAS